MNKYILSFLLAACSLTVSAQKLYFVYLQTESDQPFYVKLNEKVHSSSASGYLILSKLKDTAYSLTLGFAQNKWPEQNFLITIGRKDHGFLVKNFGEKGWGLFNLQTLEIIMPASGKTAGSGTANNDVSGFTAILSKAADDPSLKEKPQKPAAEEKKADVAPEMKPIATEGAITGQADKPGNPAPVQENVPSKPQPVKPEDAVVKPVTEKSLTTDVTTPLKAEPVVTPPVVASIAEPVKEEQKQVIIAEEKKEETKAPEIKAEEPVPAPAEAYKMSTVTRRSESSTTEGFGLVYLDKYENGVIDTVRLLIPNPKPVLPIVKDEPKVEKKMLDIPVEIVKAEEKPVPEAPMQTAAVLTPVTESKPAEKTNCPEVAAETDFFKLRKAMAAAESDDEMISEAKKYFKLKCFTTAQVKNLGTLFLTDQGKYNFFDAAYPFAADTVNFNTLQAELKDEYYINRFRAMLRN